MDPDKRIAILGGTFTPLHDGHRALLHKAFQTASHDGNGDGHVIVALTATALAKRTRSDPAHSEQLGTFRHRCDSLDAEMRELSGAYTASYEIIKLNDPYGPAATREEIDALVVSPEGSAQHRAHEINTQRVADGLAAIEIHTAPFVIADDGTRISSTRIRDGEIDTHGQLLEGSE